MEGGWKVQKNLNYREHNDCREQTGRFCSSPKEAQGTSSRRFPLSNLCHFWVSQFQKVAIPCCLLPIRLQYCVSKSGPGVDQCLLDMTGLLHPWTQRWSTACTRPTQEQANQHYSMEPRRLRSPTPSWGCIESWWFLGRRRVSFFSSHLWLLVDWSCSNRWPHTHVYKNSTNWTRYFLIVLFCFFF